MSTRARLLCMLPETADLTTQPLRPGAHLCVKKRVFQKDLCNNERQPNDKTKCIFQLTILVIRQLILHESMSSHNTQKTT